jgi:hypothetical protein
MSQFLHVSDDLEYIKVKIKAVLVTGHGGP